MNFAEVSAASEVVDAAGVVILIDIDGPVNIDPAPAESELEKCVELEGSMTSAMSSGLSAMTSLLEASEWMKESRDPGRSRV